MVHTIHSQTVEALTCYDWPGNIRELQNVIERAVIISKGSVLNVPLTDFKFEISRTSLANTKVSSTHHENLKQVLNETERSEILRALEEANGVVSGPDGAAARLGIKRTTLQSRMQKFGIHVSRTTVDRRRQTLG